MKKCKISETEYTDQTLEKAYLMGYEAQAIEFMEAAQ